MASVRRSALIFHAAGYLGMVSLPQLWLIAIGIWAMSAMLSRLWLTHREMGPAEALLRWIAYGGPKAAGHAAPL